MKILFKLFGWLEVKCGLIKNKFDNNPKIVNYPVVEEKLQNHDVELLKAFDKLVSDTSFDILFYSIDMNNSWYILVDDRPISNKLLVTKEKDKYYYELIQKRYNNDNVNSQITSCYIEKCVESDTMVQKITKMLEQKSIKSVIERMAMAEPTTDKTVDTDHE